MKSSLMEHKGKKIFLARYDNMSAEEVKAEVEAVKHFMSTAPERSALVMVDATGTLVSPEVLKQFKEIAAMASGSLKTKTAILGMSGPRKIFLELVGKLTNNQTIPFDDRNSALDWLVS